MKLKIEFLSCCVFNSHMQLVVTKLNNTDRTFPLPLKVLLGSTKGRLYIKINLQVSNSLLQMKELKTKNCR